jgi:hypothetical protein
LKEEDDMQEVKGLLVFYIDVGRLPPFRAEAFIDRMKEKFQDDQKRNFILPHDIGCFFVPVRGSHTRVDYIAFDAEDADRIEDFANRLRKWEEGWKEEIRKMEAAYDQEKKVEHRPIWEKLMFWK